ncbi:MAG: hypothetical protein ACXAC7_18150 [Candidatus Hodarchaeales archaeon]|jgi:hypothetical protein
MDKSKLEALFRDLYKIAMDDGLITEEEQRILDSVTKNIDSFITALEEAMADNIITKEENELLNNIYDKIYDESADIANEDNQLTTDEFKLLVKLIETIRQNY